MKRGTTILDKKLLAREVRLRARVWSNFYHFLGFGFGSGLSPFAPGTFGTLAAIPVYLMMIWYLPIWLYVTLTLFFLLGGVIICDKVSKDLQVHDFSGIVWDEIVGYLITMMFFPFSWSMVVIGFVMFRIFDIIKPWPINWLDRKVSGGLGIMLDDVLAGIFAWICLFIIYSLEII